MKKAYRVCKSYEFTSIIQHRSFVISSSFVCYYMPRKESHARVGISVGKKLGNAVVRNKVKRQVRSMVDDIYDFNETFDTIIIVRPRYHQKSYQENWKQLKQDKERLEKRKDKR